MKFSLTRTVRTVVVSALALAVLIGCSSKEIDPETLPAELVKFQPAFKVQRVWSKGIGGKTENLRLGLRPATDGTNIYAAAHDGRVMAFEAVKGKQVWSAKTDLPLSAGPSSDGKLVVAGSSNGEIIALDALTGEQLWVVEVTSEVLGAPALSPGMVLVQTVNGKLTALSADDGSALWSIQQSMPRLSVRGTSSPVIAKKIVVTGFDNGRVAAYDLEDGGIIWDVLMDPPSGRNELDRLIDINSSVSVAGNDVYAIGYQGRVGGIALESGRLLWSQELSSHSGFSVDLASIYITDQRSELVAISRGSGRELWRRLDTRNRDVTGPAVFGASIVVGDFEGYLHWFDLQTGALQARIKAGSDRISGQPLVLNNLLYVMTDGGSLYAYRLKPEKKRRGD